VIEVNGLLADVATNFSGQAEAAGIALTVERAPGQTRCPGDAGRLDQVLGNLVAVPCSIPNPAGGSLCGPRQSQEARLQVLMTGGYRPKTCHIFDRFWREPARGERHAAAGWGWRSLASGRSLMEVISVSQPGKVHCNRARLGQKKQEDSREFRRNR
jgi:hypothetical protein